MSLARSPVRRPWHLARASRVLRALLPSFLADVVWPEHHYQLLQQHQEQVSKKKLHPTSYLDGLRGIASFIVFFCHYTELRHGYFVPTYGLDQENRGPSAFIQLPYFRLIYSGRPMVHIFFVISGFVLSYKPIRLLHGTGDSPGNSPPGSRLERCYTALASSVFRRPIRLFLPCAVSTLIIAVMAQTGHLYAPAESWSMQLHNWYGVYTRGITWPWSWDHDMMPAYDIHLWTIPIEFAHSMLLFLALLGLSRLRTRLRLVANLGLISYCITCGKWAAFEFLAGLFLAEIHVLRSLSSQSSPPSPFATAQRVKIEGGGNDSVLSTGEKEGFLDSLESRLDCQIPHRIRGRLDITRRCLRTLFHSTILMTCLFVLGWPNDEVEKTPGIRYLYANTPVSFMVNGDGEGNLMAQKFWFGISAIFIVWSSGELAFVRGWFEGQVAQYCGRISYAIYIVHGPGLDYFQDMVLGQPAEPAQGTMSTDGYVPAKAGTGVKGMIGVETPTQRMMTWLVGLLILGPVVVWIADLFWRFVDAPIVNLGRTIEQACICNAEPSILDQRTIKERAGEGHAI